MQKSKLIGIELGRGLSTFAVVLVHSGDETWGAPIDPNAIGFRLLFYFAVPFFLLTAFYFMTAKSDQGNSKKFWKSRFQRICVPYILWSLVFFLSRVIVFSVGHKLERLQQLLADPLSLIFLGGASYHLYFLPLLIVGTGLLLLMPVLERLKLSSYALIFLSILSILPPYLMESSGNSFHLGDYTAFNQLTNIWQLNMVQYPWLRVALVVIAWSIRCLPYFMIAFTFNRLPSGIRYPLLNAHPIGWAMLVILGDLPFRGLLPGTLSDLFLAFSLLLFCISLSNFSLQRSLSNSAISHILLSIGACSFGIYLCHPFVMNLVKPLLNKALPQIMASVSIPSMLLISIPSFLISWLIVSYLSRNRAISKYLFGT
jgi:peptidoglycan/LPS O-acetylase OafA/YrhL